MLSSYQERLVKETVERIHGKNKDSIYKELYDLAVKIILTKEFELDRFNYSEEGSNDV